MPVEKLIPPRSRDLGGGFMVRRLLPVLTPRQGVGPFVFFDHFGPVAHAPRRQPRRAAASAHRARDRHLPVRRRDAASRQPGQRPAHRAGRDQLDDGRARHRPLGARAARLEGQGYVAHGLQLWAALPAAHEEMRPSSRTRRRPRCRSGRRRGSACACSSAAPSAFVRR